MEPPAAEPPAPPVAPPAPAAAASSPAPAGPAAQLAGAVVEFEFARSDLAGSNAADVLGSVIEVLRASPSLTIVITGFTDNWGPPEINQQLSEARAASVQAALVAAGVDPARLSTVGLADREPVAANDTYWGRSRNRRIEFRTSN
ncbi:MAG: OmpA family protein [Acidimicrobiales bacterium]